MNSSQFISSDVLLVELATLLGIAVIVVAIRRVAIKSDVVNRIYARCSPVIFDAIDSYYSYVEIKEAATSRSFASVAAAAFEIARQRDPDIELQLKPTITRRLLHRLDRDFSPTAHEAKKEQFKSAQNGLELGKEVFDLLNS